MNASTPEMRIKEMSITELTTVMDRARRLLADSDETSKAAKFIGKRTRNLKMTEQRAVTATRQLLVLIEAEIARRAQ